MRIDTSIRNSCNALISVIIFWMYLSMSDATCSLPQDLINTAWEYNYTNVEDNTEQSTTLNFATTTLQNSAINLDAKGTTIDDWTCINSLGISDTEAVVVFKSDNSFSDGPFAGSQWLYLCMKLTKVTTDLYYFYLLSDTFTGVSPDERVFASSEGNPPNNNDPVCSTFCQYTESPNIRTLQKPGTHDALPNGASLCEPCGSSCKVATTEMTSTESTQKTTIPPTSTEIDTAIELTSKETTPITSQPTTSTEIDIITTIQSTDITQITSQPTTSTEVNTIITIQSTETTYIPTMHSTSTETVTTADMTSTNANKETTIPNTSTELGTTTKVESPTTSLEINPLPTSTEMDSLTETTTKETTQTTAVHSTVVDSETTQITTTQFTTKDTETTTELKMLTTDLKVETTLETLVTEASCALPEDLKNTLWEYNYTDVANNEEQTTNLYIANTTLPDSVINLNAEGTIVNNWTCINSLDISDTTNVVVFKSDASFPSGGGSRRLYLCMKLTKVTPDLFYFHLLSDIATSLFPNERVFISEADNAPADNATICRTFCQYTNSPKIRTLRRQGSSVSLPSNVSLCEPCDSACKEATTMMTSLETTQKHTLPSTSTEIDITTDRTSTENTQKTSKPSTSEAIDTTTYVMSTVTTQLTTLSSTSTEIDSTTEISITKTPETTLQTTSTPTEMESLTESATTAPKTTLHTTSTEMDTTLQLKSTDTTQNTAVHSTVTDLKTSTQTTIQSASTNTETTTELKVTTTDLKDETTLETKLTENLKRYSGPITLVGISCAGFVLVIIIFCLLKGTSMNSTEEIANNGEEKAYAASPENCYKLYKGKQFGLQEIAIRRWDYH